MKPSIIHFNIRADKRRGYTFPSARTLASAVMCILFFAHCTKILDTKPVSSIESSVFYDSEEAAEIGLTGCYNKFFNENAYPLLIVFFQVSTDDIKQSSGWGFQLKDRTQLTPNPSTGGGYNTPWARLYTAIANVNMMLAGVSEIPDEKFEGNRKKEILAEGHFLRGACYYYLSMLWGDVPIVLDLKTGGSEDNEVPKSTQAQVLEQAKADFQIAEADLPQDLLNYSNDATTNARKGRASKWAAKAYLARIALWENDKPRALQLSEEVINSELFPLATKWRSIFEGSMNSSESIFEQQNDYSPGFFGSGLFAWYMGFDLEIADTLYKVFDTPDVMKESQGKDIRFDFMYADHPWTSGTMAIRKHVPPRGYEQGGVEQMNILLIRATELHFNKYEILIEQDYEANKTSALDFLNVIRGRAKDETWVNPYFPAMPAATIGIPLLALSDVDTKDKMLNALKAEKRREMIYEDGIRWFDIMRWDKTYAMQITNASSESRLYLPIPEDEIIRNPKLEQNPAY